MITKYKVSEVAKDFGLQNKDITDILAKHFDEPKKSQTALDTKELDVLFDVLTQENSVENFNAYFAMKKQEEKKPEKKEAPKKENKPAEKKQENKPADKKAENKPAEKRRTTSLATKSRKRKLTTSLRKRSPRVSQTQTPLRKTKRRKTAPCSQEQRVKSVQSTQELKIFSLINITKDMKISLLFIQSMIMYRQSRN